MTDERRCVMCGERSRMNDQPQCHECRNATMALRRYWWDHGMRLSSHRSLWAARHLTFLLEQTT